MPPCCAVLKADKSPRRWSQVSYLGIARAAQPWARRDANNWAQLPQGTWCIGWACGKWGVAQCSLSVVWYCIIKGYLQGSWTLFWREESSSLVEVVWVYGGLSVQQSPGAVACLVGKRYFQREDLLRHFKCGWAGTGSSSLPFRNCCREHHYRLVALYPQSCKVLYVVGNY